jgi:hypothetical protein
MSAPKLTRRAALAGAPAVAIAMAGGTAVLAVTHDPIFAVIAAHKLAERAHSDAVLAQSRLEDELPSEKRRSFVYATEEEIVETDDPRWIAAARAVAEASNHLDDSAMAMLNGRPTTLAGMSALFRYVSEEADNGCLPDGIEGDRDYEHFEAALLSEAADWLGVMPEGLAAGVAKAATTTTPDPAGLSTNLDPIFAAIECERAAHAAYLATAAIQSEVADQDPHPLARPADRKAEKKRLANPQHKAWWARYEEAEKAHGHSADNLWAAREALLQTHPTTVAGLLAFLDHIEGPFSSDAAGEAFWDEQEHKIAFPTLAAAVRELVIGRQA